MSLAVNPVTVSLKVTVKLIGLALVGSAWPDAWLIVTLGASGWTKMVEAMEGVPLLPIANSIQSPGETTFELVGRVTPRLPSACTEKESSIRRAVILKECEVEPNGINANVRMFAGLSTGTVNVWPGLRSGGACWMTGRTAGAPLASNR